MSEGAVPASPGGERGLPLLWHWSDRDRSPAIDIARTPPRAPPQWGEAEARAAGLLTSADRLASGRTNESFTESVIWDAYSCSAAPSPGSSARGGRLSRQASGQTPLRKNLGNEFDSTPFREPSGPDGPVRSGAAVAGRRFARVTASCLVIAASGAQFGFSELVPHLARLDPSGAGRGRAAAVAAASLLFAAFAAGCALAARASKGRSLDLPCRAAVLCASPLQLLPAAMPLAARTSPAALCACTALLGLALGHSHFYGMVHLQSWLPTQPARASAMLIAAGGAGSVAASAGIESAAARLGTGRACFALALSMFALAVLGGASMAMPMHVRDVSVRVISGRTSPLDSFLGERLLPGEIAHSRPFILLWLAAFFALGPGFALLANLAPALHDHPGLPLSSAALAVATFNGCTALVGKGGALFFVEGLRRTGRRFPATFYASKNALAALLVLQSGAVLALPWAMERQGAALALCVAALGSLLGAGYLFVSVLSRETFAPANSGTVYGLILTSVATSALVYPNAFQLLAGKTGGEMPFCVAAAALGLLGAVATVAITPLEQAFEP